jgi:hypothetical protein
MLAISLPRFAGKIVINAPPAQGGQWAGAPESLKISDRIRCTVEPVPSLSARQATQLMVGSRT